MLGPTAAGKSAVAMLIAERIGAEIVSVDSMQVYRGMDIGTAKASINDRGRVPHHMIDVVDPSQPYSVAEFRAEAASSTADVAGPLLIVGGSGLHFRSLVDPFEFAPADTDVRAELAGLATEDLVGELLDADPAAGSHVDMANRRRVERAVEILRITGMTPTRRATTRRAAAVRSYQPERPLVAVGLDPGPVLRERVKRRFSRMTESGLSAEVEALLPHWGATASQAVGYREMARVVSGEWVLEEGIKRAVDATTSLARRQRTYFRRDPRIDWLEWDDDPRPLAERALHRFREAEWIS